MTSGVSFGVSGWEGRAFRRAWLMLFGFMALITTVNAVSVLQDRAAIGRPLPGWEPVVWEYTSGLCILAFAVIPWLAIRFAPPRRGRWVRFVLTHAAASLGFSILHVAGMFALRAVVYGALGHRYAETLASFPYEYRKDLVTYAFCVAVFWLIRRLSEPAAAPAGTETPPCFDIRDGARLLRVPIADIVSVASAGNYVEISLADGRKPLMRATLARLEAELSPHGFVRTHRSWLVNSARLRGLDPEGSGDFTVELDGGLKAPLSRRFPQALDRLRAAG